MARTKSRMTTPAAKLLRADECFDWANSRENAARPYELDKGRVVEVSRPGERRGAACANVGFVLGGYIRRRRRP